MLWFYSCDYQSFVSLMSIILDLGEDNSLMDDINLRFFYNASYIKSL